MSLFDKIDETAASDADYITTSTAGSVAELKLGPVADPGVDTGHSIKVRASGSGTLGVDLVQGNGASMMIWTSRTRTRQPPGVVGASSKFRRIEWLWSANNSGIPAEIRSVTGRSAPYADGNNLLYQKATANGIAADWSGLTESVTAYTTSYGILHGATEYTMIVWMQFDSAGTSVQWLNFRDDVQYSMDVFSQTSSSITFGTDWAGAWNGTSQQTVSGLVHGQMVCIAAAVDQSGARFYANGVTLGTKSGSGFTISSTSTKVVKGPVLPLYGGCVSSKAWSAEELLSVTANPWQLFAPTKRPIYFQTQKLIASRTIPLIATPTDYRRELLPAEAALITDYTDLRVRFRGV